MILEATCPKCGEVFIPADDTDLVHLVRNDGQPCGGRAAGVDGFWVTTPDDSLAHVVNAKLPPMAWVSVVIQADGMADVEVLDACPTASFIEGLEEAVRFGQVRAWTIREGYVNGGDTAVVQSGGAWA